MTTIYRKYDPGTYHSRDLYRIVCQTNDLRPVWAHKNVPNGVDVDLFLAKCENHCSCCKSPLNYGLGKNNLEAKLDVNTPSTDHIISRDEAKKLGWSEEHINDIGNLWIVCMRCNRLKNNSTAEDILRYKAIIEVLERNKTILSESS